MTRPGIECKRVADGMEVPLAEFFACLAAAGVDRFFHPHPFDAETARALCLHPTDDLYYALCEGGTVLAYGLLRGWEEGFEVPSLGIAVRPDAAGQGLGRALMEFLHAAARRRGAPAVRLKVHAENEAAVALYRSLGYAFDGKEDGQLVARLEL